MSISIKKQKGAFALSPVAAACTLLVLASSAHAQVAAPAPAASAVQEVTVTGIRGAIESAISVKKNADGVVEAISAEDIGKLPDTTIAESLARLPGVTTQRNAQGQATNISIRGLGPDFNGYLLNGREQTSTGDSRAVDLSVYPAELIGGATVYKTQDAGLMAAGLAGTIDNRLVNPFDFRGRVFSANIDKTKSGVGLPVTGNGKRYSLSYIDQFSDRRLGIALGVVHSESSSSSLANGSWGNTPGSITDTTGAVVPSVKVPFGGGLGFETDHVTDKRDGGAAIIVFKPIPELNSELDLYYAKIKTGTKKVVLNRGSNGGNITNATINNGVVESGTFTMAPGSLLVKSENIFDDDTIKSIGWKNTYTFNDSWKGSLDLSHNSAQRVERDIEVYGQNAVADTLSFTNGGSAFPQFTVGNPTSYTDPTQIAIQDVSGWSGVSYASGPYAGKTVPQAGYSKGPTINDKLDAVRLDFSHALSDAGMFTDLQFGGNYTKRSKDRITNEGLIVSSGNGGYDRIPLPGNAYVENNVGGTGMNVLTFDPQAALWSGAVILPKFNDDILSKTWTVQEKVTTAYAKLNLDTTLQNIPVRGNVGLQIVHTDQSSAGFRADVSSNVTLNNPAGALSTNGTSYNDVLPSLNLTGNLGNGNFLRLGAGVQIARPTLTDMRNSFAASVDTNAGNATYGKFVGSAGNPNLKPFKAKALDISYEKYFGQKAYYSIAGFYKKLDTYIVQGTDPGYDFTTYATQLGLAIPPGGPIGVFTTTSNGSGGNLKGFELAGSLPLDMLSSYLDGFGVSSSYSNTTSSVKLPNLIGLKPNDRVPSLGTISLPGLSHINAKLQMYFEKAGFSASVAQNYRSAYIGSVSNTTIGGYPTLINIAAQTWVSAQIGYDFDSGTLKGLGLRFEGNNMNKPVYKEYKADGSLNTSNQTGASYTFKLSYKFQ